MASYKECKICSGDVDLINEKFNLGKCRSCQLIFCLTIYSQEEFIALYDKLYNAHKSQYERHSVVEFNEIINQNKIKIGFHRARLIAKTILNVPCNSVIEIGSGIGLVGMYLRLKNAKIQYLGIELDKEAYEKSQVLKLNTLNGDFKELENVEIEADVLMMWEVIEHLQDLKLFMELANKKIKTGGKIILSTPNYNKIHNYPNRTKDQLFQDQPPIHVNFFTDENLKNIFELYGFSDCRIVVKKFPYVDLRKRKFYTDCIKSITNSYNGSTIYLEATKNIPK